MTADKSLFCRGNNAPNENHGYYTEVGKKGGIAYINTSNNYTNTVPYSNETLIQLCTDIFAEADACE